MTRPSFIKKGSTRRSDDTMDDDLDDKDDTKRKSRNLSEKKRRDQFNVLINELSSMVSTNTRKMDKSTVLKSTISYLRNHNEITVQSRVHEIQEDWKPSFLSNGEFTHLFLEALDGFIMVFSSSGKIFYASESITSLLGHLPSDLLNLTIYDLVYEADQQELYNVLLNPSNLNYNESMSKDSLVSLSCHLKRGGLEANEQLVYELVHFEGYFRSDLSPLDVESDAGEADTRLVFVATGHLQVPLLIRDIYIADRAKNEFTSRHSLEWKFLFLDHRAPPIIGYLPFEVLGTSGYDYYHVDDLEKVVTCHEALMQKGEGTSCHYRFLMKGQQWIWLQTRFYITYHQWNSKPEFIVCTHRVVSYVDMVRHLRRKSEGLDGEDNTLDGSPDRCEPAQSLLNSSPWSNKSLPRSPKVRARSNSESTDSRQSHFTAHSSRSRCGAPPAPAPPTSPPEQPLQLVAVAPLVAAPPLMLTTSQTQVQEQLQRKHAQLQQLIVAQQDELRRVSEQLVMARYGLLPGMPVYTAPTSVSSTTPGLICSPTPHTTADMLVGRALPLAFAPQPSLMIDPHQLNLQSHATDEATPIQLSQQQAQLLFNLPNLPTTQQHP